MSHQNVTYWERKEAGAGPGGAGRLLRISDCVNSTYVGAPCNHAPTTNALL